MAQYALTVKNRSYNMTLQTIEPVQLERVFNYFFTVAIRQPLGIRGDGQLEGYFEKIVDKNGSKNHLVLMCAAN